MTYAYGFHVLQKKMNLKSTFTAYVAALALTQLTYSDSGFYFTTLSVLVSDPTEETSPMWYFDSTDYFSAEKYWNNPETPIEKRLAVFEHVSDRLAFTFYACPKIEEKVDFKIEEATFAEVIAELEKGIGSQIPNELDIPDDFTASVTVAGYRAFEVIESICAQGGLEITFTKDLMTISKKDEVEPDGGHNSGSSAASIVTP